MGRIYLIGLPGVGKTTLGQKIADFMNLPFVDIDCMLHEEAGMSVADIFSTYGEPHFRDLESQMLAAIAAKPFDAVIATGGGIILREENRSCLRQSGTVVYLDRSPESIIKDIHVEERPLLAKNPMRLFELSKERSALYSECCHISVSLPLGVEESLEHLQEVFSHLEAQ
ncbi:MAG: shikimate kinase [Synergistaceae bacterium]|nr:shikimate kinase [Synergistaceae bacterium]MBP9626507.1 shikimate kinase [Synergistaceae bacterium]MBP9957505.1 shikimate kinase [Synergistaceae bacterium]